MGLSNDLISQFVKATNPEEETKKESIVYGTVVKQGNSDFVKIDGSELLTPVTSTIVIKDGERVTVMIKNHTAIVTGNISSPSASDKDVQDVVDKVSDFEIVIADKVSTKEFDAEKGRIDDLVTDTLLVKDKITANEAAIGKVVADNVIINGKLSGYEAEFTEIKTKKLDAETADLKYATIGSLEAIDIRTHNLESDYGEFKDLTTDKFKATDAQIGTIVADNVVINQKISGYQAEFEEIKTKKLDADTANITYAKIETVEALDIKVNELVAGSITTDYLESNYAKIDLANIKDGCITTAMIGEGVIGNVQIADGSITDAKIVGLTANKITAGTLDAATIKVINLDCANLTVGTINGKQIESGAIDLSKLDEALSGTITTTSEEVKQALIDAGLAQDTADDAQKDATKALEDALKAYQEAQAAKLAAGSAQTSADGKTTNYYKPTAPTGTFKVGDTWFNTAQDNAMSYWDGTQWKKQEFGAGALEDDAVTADKIAQDVNQKISDAFANAGTAITEAQNAKQDASTAKTDASTAKTDASTAKTEASSAKTKAEQASKDATSAKTDASTAKTTADAAKQLADTAKTISDAAKKAAEDAAKDLTALDGKLTTVESTVTNNTSKLTAQGGKISALESVTTETNKQVTAVKGEVTTAKQNITTLQTNYSSLESSLNGLTVTVGQHTSSINTVTKTVTDNKSNWDKAATALTMATDAKNKIDNLAIGGRNLALGTTKPRENLRNCDYSISAIGYEKTKYTVSFYAKAQKATTANVYVNDDTGQTRWNFYFASSVPITTEYKKFVFTADSPKEYYGAVNSIVIRVYGMATDSLLSVKNLKLEKGTKDTDHSPAPEDIDTRITAEIKTVTDKQATFQTTLDGITGRVSSVETTTTTVKNTVDANKTNWDKAVTALNTANTAKTTAENASNTASTAKSTADSAASTASIAKTAADEAKTDASTAKTTASSAVTTANTAKSTADTAKSTADSAKSTATTASTNASNALNKANSALLADKVIPLSGTSKLFKNVASFNNDNSGVKGAFVITTPIKPNTMCRIHITGYNYIANKNNNIDLIIACYNYGSDIRESSYTNNGNVVFSSVKLAKVSSSDNRLVIILGGVTDIWQYPKLCVESVMTGFTTAPDSYKDGWSISLATTLSTAYVHTISLIGMNVQSEITTVKTKESNLELTVDQFKTSVASTYATKTQLSTVDGKFASYSTTTQMNSAITAKANEINLAVSKTYATQASVSTVDGKFANYSTTTQMNSAITAKANEITLSVEKKVDKTSIIAAINLTSEAVKISASKIDLSGYVTITNIGTAGKTVIDGGNVKTGTITATQIASNAITAVKIAGRTITADKLVAKTLTAASGVFADACIVTANIANLAVTSAKIANLAVGNAQIANAAITTAKIANLSITNALIANGAIDNAKIANLDAGKITTGTISADRIAAGSIVLGKLDSSTQSTITTAKNNAQSALNQLTLNAQTKLNGVELLDQRFNADTTARPFDTGSYTVVPATEVSGGNANSSNLIKTVNAQFLCTPKIPFNAAYPFYWSMDAYNLSTNDGQIYIQVCFYDKKGTPVADNEAAVNIIGAAVLSGANKWQTLEGWSPVLGETDLRRKAYYARVRYLPRYSGKSGTTYIRNIHFKQLGSNSTAQFNTIDSVIGAWCYNNDRTYINGGKLYTGTVTATQIAANAIVAGKIATNAVTAGTIVAGAISADKLAANAVVAGKIAANAVTTATIAAGAVNADKISSNAILAKHISAGVITGDKLVAATITGAKIAARTIAANNIVAGAITAAEIKSGTITATQIASGTITATQLASNSVTAVKIAAGNVTTDKLAAGAVTAAKIAAGAVTAGTIAAGAITTDKLGAGAVTAAKIAAGAITATQIASKAITADKLNVTSLSAITGNIGSITSGSINIGGGKFVVNSSGALTATSANISGTITATSGSVGGWAMDTNRLYKQQVMNWPKFTSADYEKIKDYINGYVTLTAAEKEKYDIFNDGKVTAQDYVIVKQMVTGALPTTTTVLTELNSNNPKAAIKISSIAGAFANNVTAISPFGISTERLNVGSGYFTGTLTCSDLNATSITTGVSGIADVKINDQWIGFYEDRNLFARKGWLGFDSTANFTLTNEIGESFFFKSCNSAYSGNGYLQIYSSKGSDGCYNYRTNATTHWFDKQVSAPSWITRSKEKYKTNIMEFSNTSKSALNMVRASNIYQYNLKEELTNGTYNKHYGFIVERETPSEIIAGGGDGIDTYSLASINWQATKELADRFDSTKYELLKEIQNLKQEIEMLKERLQ